MNDLKRPYEPKNARLHRELHQLQQALARFGGYQGVEIPPAERFTSDGRIPREILVRDQGLAELFIAHQSLRLGGVVLNGGSEPLAAGLARVALFAAREGARAERDRLDLPLEEEGDDPLLEARRERNLWVLHVLNDERADYHEEMEEAVEEFIRKANAAALGEGE